MVVSGCLSGDGHDLLDLTSTSPGCTHACVAGAARDAVPLGYAVIVVDDA